MSSTSCGGGGSAFASVHKVHRDILRLVGTGMVFNSLLLQGGEAEPLAEVGEVFSLGLSSTRIKGRGLAALRRWFDRRSLAQVAGSASAAVGAT